VVRGRCRGAWHRRGACQTGAVAAPNAADEPPASAGERRPSTTDRRPPRSRRIALLGLLPSAVYIVFFAFYTPWLSHFSSHFFGDGGDGLQNAWNLWWTRRALWGLESLWHTDLLHHPHGTTLLGHTLAPVNGLLAATLLAPLPLVQAYNVVVTLAFVATGLTAFWLCYWVSRSVVGSLLGGFAFTFSSYHFAHAIGHMNLITLQFVPLFVLAWLAFLRAPGLGRAALASLALGFVALTDFYYVFYSVLAALVLAAFLAARQGLPLGRPALRSYGAFAALSLLFAAPLPLAFLVSHLRDPFVPAHDARLWGADLLAPFIPGEIWRFSSLTSWHWSTIHMNVVEGSVSLGFVALACAAVALSRRRLRGTAAPWLGLGLVFALLALGPTLHVMGETYEHVPMPYAGLAWAFPLLELSGVPVRMLMMTMLSLSVVVAIVLGRVDVRRPLGAAAVAAAAVVLFVESWPAELPRTEAEAPIYVHHLGGLPAGAVVEQRATITEVLFHQTVHGKPLVGGYISRLTENVTGKSGMLAALVEAEDFVTLRDAHGVRYVIRAPDVHSERLPFPTFLDATARVYDLEDLP
jgi:hypothetical protein